MRYDELAPMLLNEMQQQQQKIVAQANINAAQAEHIAAQGAQLRDVHQQLAELKDLKQELHSALIKLHTNAEFVVQR